MLIAGSRVATMRSAAPPWPHLSYLLEGVSREPGLLFENPSPLPSNAIVALLMAW